MIKAVIFDCFGVLVEETYRPFFRTYFQADADKLEQAREVNRMAATGRMSQAEAISRFAELAGLSMAETVKQLTGNPTNEQLFEYIRDTLRPKYKIGMLSNVSGDRLAELFDDAQCAQFDDFVLSYAVGVAKPDSQIYELAAERLGMLPEECVFVDDIERYCDGAERIGMHSILYTNFIEFEERLKDITRRNI